MKTFEKYLTLWVMIYPMMLKVDFNSVKNVGHQPKGLIVTCGTMYRNGLCVEQHSLPSLAYLSKYL